MLAKVQKLERLEVAARQAAKKNPHKRMQVNAIVLRIRQTVFDQTSHFHSEADEKRYFEARQERIVRGICKRANVWFTDQGFHVQRGDFRTTRVLDWVPRHALDAGHGGLVLIEVIRERVYGQSCRLHTSSAKTRFLVGREINGRFFAHPVSRLCKTVEEALQWIWDGSSDQILRRVGEIAIVRGKRSKLPKLPEGYLWDGDQIRHPDYPSIRVPGMYERLIVARRAEDCTGVEKPKKLLHRPPSYGVGSLYDTNREKTGNFSTQLGR